MGLFPAKECLFKCKQGSRGQKKKFSFSEQNNKGQCLQFRGKRRRILVRVLPGSLPVKPPPTRGALCGGVLRVSRKQEDLVLLCRSEGKLRKNGTVKTTIRQRQKSMVRECVGSRAESICTKNVPHITAFLHLLHASQNFTTNSQLTATYGDEFARGTERT
jgi:hypothetical protein